MSVRCFRLEPTGEEIREACGGENCGGYCRREGYCTTYRPLRRTDTGEVYKSWAGAPVGAMMDCVWLLDCALPEADILARRQRDPGKRFLDIRKHPDGRVLMVKTPGGDWIIDQMTAQGGFWTRTGEPPNVTARPSIITGDYHGWLTNGELIPV